MKFKVIFSLFLLVAVTSVHAGLEVGYYEKKNCSQAEKIVREVVEKELGIPIVLFGYPLFDVSVGPGLVRLLFHDCFVRGCDGSVLLDKGLNNSRSEKDASKNLGLRGFEIIDEAKKRLEETCPGVVSCADILVFAARDATQIMLNAIYHEYIEFNVSSGRLDSKNSFYDQVETSLPPPEFNLKELTDLFSLRSNENLNVTDLVVLSGAHTFGVSHCSSIKNRLDSNDPTLDQNYAAQLREICRSSTHPDTNPVVNLDKQTPYELDSLYYQNVQRGTALFYSDSSLLNGTETKDLVNEYAQPVNDWAEDFVKSMKKLSELNVMFDTDPEGEIRKICRKVNNKVNGY
ncbi:hypothetical protein LUZ61_001836 [Rhynchospora tenuis]|uniref:Peroxidase n=1 Tax=Rhynchospora tenuis TaxID=198213 RepID=A0AAD5ZHR5_9POAL|nr:hypothetical protein LUZ61_001836 [Rhynchospora tenuis]